ncbi:hypothetical protein ABE033_10360 [Priestia megaterium]
MVRFVMINTLLESFEFEEYTNDLMHTVENTLGAKDIEFYSNKEQTRKCSLMLNDKEYFVYFTCVITHGTFQLKIDIKVSEKEVYDKDLHELKIKIKDLIIPEWEQCLWLEDQQSEKLAEELYRNVHSVENGLRRLINTVLFYNLGGDWWEKYMPVHLTNTYDKRNDPYQDRVTSFKNVHTNLLSIDTDDLVSILEFKTYKVKEETVFNEPTPSRYSESNIQHKQQINQFEHIMSNIMNDKKTIDLHQKGLTELLKKQMEVNIDFWNDFFSPWFSCSLSEFSGKWTNFSNDRNHVAHNKLIDYKMYQKFKKSMDGLLLIITKAEEKFDKHLEEAAALYLTELKHREKEEAYKDTVELRNQEEARISILDAGQIIQMLQKYINGTFGNIKEEIYFRSDVEVTYNEPTLIAYEKAFEINHNIIKSNIRVNVEPYIDDFNDCTSNVHLLVYSGDLFKERFEISFTNGMPKFDEEQVSLISEIETELNVSSLKNLEAFIYKLIEETMPDVSEDDLASYACENCQQYAVNLSTYNQYGLGTCMYCGHENIVGECVRCESILNQLHDGLCECCIEYIYLQ